MTNEEKYKILIGYLYTKNTLEHIATNENIKESNFAKIKFFI